MPTICIHNIIKFLKVIFKMFSINYKFNTLIKTDNNECKKPVLTSKVIKSINALNPLK